MTEDKKPFLRLIHLSDLHLDTRSNGVPSHDPSAIPAISREIKRLRRDSVSTHLVITGDLTERGHPDEIVQVRKVLTEPRKFNDPDALIVPGNHDICQGRLFGFGAQQGKNPMDDPAFGDFFGAVPSVSKIVEHPFPYVRRLQEDGFDVYIYGINTTELYLSEQAHDAGNFRIFRACGFVGDNQIDRLKQLISQERGDKILRIALMHHPIAYETSLSKAGHILPHQPYSGTAGTFRQLIRRAFPYTWSLIDYTKVHRALHKLNFHFVLCGHQHRPYIWPNPDECPGYNPFVLSVGSASKRIVRRRKQEFRVYEFRCREYTDTVEIKIDSYYRGLGDHKFNPPQEIFHGEVKAGYLPSPPP